MKSRWAVLKFPGSNGEGDALKALSAYPVKLVEHWHEDPIQVGDYELLILPGGFSYGDYLRAGAIAKHAPALKNLHEVISEGCHVMGICNGFQILLEARLIPGFLQVNSSLKFISDMVDCHLNHAVEPWIRKEDCGKRLKLPVAHRFGNYQVSRVDRSELVAALTYEVDLNSSVDQIAGVYRSIGRGSVFAMMPHPERAAFEALGANDGRLFFDNAFEFLSERGTS
ncbi:MAG: phosphoribosylformylglycinamidine synthase I [Bradymonadales bacterium]|nr:MAG: phosphoribosylformylglycinamidine synthase I [Bradymonadales bacterium]